MNVIGNGGAYAYKPHGTAHNLESNLKNQRPQQLPKISFIDMDADGIGIRTLFYISCTPGVSPVRSRVS